MLPLALLGEMGFPIDIKKGYVLLSKDTSFFQKNNTVFIARSGPMKVETLSPNLRLYLRSIPDASIKRKDR
jgi:hypothetical protein